VGVEVNTQKRNGGTEKEEKEKEEKEPRPRPLPVVSIQERIARAGNKNSLSFFFRRQK